MADTYRAGSAGSRICSSNIKQEFNGRDTLPEHSPAETDHEYDPDNLAKTRTAGAPELARRKNNRARDQRNARWKVYHGPNEQSE